MCHMKVWHAPQLGPTKALVAFGVGEQDMALMSAVFGVDGNEVTLLNQLSERGMEGGIDIRAWNRFVRHGLALHSDSARIEYARLVAALAYNQVFGDNPSPFCATRDTLVERRSRGIMAVYFNWFVMTVVARPNGHVDSLVSGSRLTSACSGRASSAGTGW